MELKKITNKEWRYESLNGLFLTIFMLPLCIIIWEDNKIYSILSFVIFNLLFTIIGYISLLKNKIDEIIDKINKEDK